ncbi:hypothetical protein PPYR_01256 [Photinus pyralis]|uniref:Conserved oligomeric Golgi complex subunit 4 n=3 Tax=Photinus pyralis TaxID=7054 RepID=A0A5N4B3Z5_PHOPY|nr:conserved oligomeric Golgi complex subunit 4-like [Photinus pyralis]XP_031327889.1 conserved oligomeric Golgi complex subunit 4-like [Photinus pyralis]XP_031327890.1 conserved oligomeric Golgi complex subunit 4-like [Photinus pyralis]KAB0804286.1 hypothetical protein PPYR_01256 [Photinus pyralis]
MTDLEEMQKELDKIKLQEEQLFEEMKHFVNQRSYVDAKIKVLSKVLPTLKSLKVETQDLVNTIHNIAESAEGISNKVRTLDCARNRVDECQQRVADLIDVGLCSEGVQTAILNEDYEKGAGHVHRFLSMDQSLLKQSATDIENVSSVLKAVGTLQDAAGQLRTIVQHKFDEAVRLEDLASVERFFKIFPLLDMHDEGIRKFCNYLCDKLRDTADKNLQTALNAPVTDKRHHVKFADTLTLLFEGLARIVDIHQPLVETYYGPGRLMSVVSFLQKECDTQVKLIIMEFQKHRQLQKKINQISEVAKMSSSSSFSKLDKLDPKELDILIQEITIMHFRMELYIKFIRRKVLADIEISVLISEERNNQILQLDKLINASDLSRRKHDLLSLYLQLEQYFMEESVSKAVGIDSTETAQQTSSMVDDTFFIIRKCIRRAISSGSLDGICAVINIACAVLENDFCGILRGRLKQGYPSGYLDLTQAYNVLQTSIQHGRLQPSDTEQIRTAFLIALNNADASTEYVETLCDSALGDVKKAIPNMNTNEHGKLESCLSGLSSVIINLKDVMEYGMQQLRVSVIKPRISPWVDSFLNINHQLNDDELSEYEAGESFVQTLIMNLDSLLSSFKDSLTSANYDGLIKILIGEVTARFEKVIFKSAFNRLGGLVLDKEVRSLSGYLTSATTWSVRDKFTRLSQIATILNLEKVTEITDYWGNHDGALTWRLTPTEVRTIMGLRIDFKQEDIQRLKL